MHAQTHDIRCVQSIIGSFHSIMDKKKIKFKVVYLTQIPDKLTAYKLYFMKMINNFCRQLLFVHKLSLITIDSENCCCGGESYMFCW